MFINVLFSNNFIKLNWWNPIPFLIILNKDVFNELYEKYQLLIKFYQLLISEFFYLLLLFFFFFFINFDPRSSSSNGCRRD